MCSTCGATGVSMCVRLIARSPTSSVVSHRSLILPAIHAAASPSCRLARRSCWSITCSGVLNEHIIGHAEHLAPEGPAAVPWLRQEGRCIGADGFDGMTEVTPRLEKDVAGDYLFGAGVRGRLQAVTVGGHTPWRLGSDSS